MIVAVETNFILELALQQAEVEQADAILRMAEAQEIRLAVPAIAFAEAYAKLAAQSKKRNVLHQNLRIEIKQMARSHPYREIEQEMKSFAEALVSSAVLYASELTKTADRLRKCVTVIPLTKEVTSEMSPFDKDFRLKSGDAFIYASIRRFLKEEAAGSRFFVTKDKDFLPTEEALAAIGCQLVLGFGAALGALKPRKAS